jgi:DNA-binding NarL/FixJ family response regulator
MGTGADAQAGIRLVLLTSDAVAGEAIAYACRSRGIRVEVVDANEVSEERVGADVVLVDLRSVGSSRAMSQRWGPRPDPRIVVLGDASQTRAVVGHDARVGLDAGVHALLAAIAGTERTPRVSTASSTRDVESLTPRERQVVQLLLAGLDVDAIANELGIAANTVRTHLQNVTAKLGVGGRAEVAAWALRAGLVPADVGAEART